MERAEICPCSPDLEAEGESYMTVGIGEIRGKVHFWDCLVKGGSLVNVFESLPHFCKQAWTYKVNGVWQSWS